MTSSIKSKNNSTKGILNLLEFSYIVFTYTINNLCEQINL